MKSWISTKELFYSEALLVCVSNISGGCLRLQWDLIQWDREILSILYLIKNRGVSRVGRTCMYKSVVLITEVSLLTCTLWGTNKKLQDSDVIIRQIWENCKVELSPNNCQDHCTINFPKTCSNTYTGDTTCTVQWTHQTALKSGYAHALF